MPNKGKIGNWPKALSKALNLTTSFIASIALGLVAGKWLDDKLAWPYLNGMLFTVIGIIVGTITSFHIMWKNLKDSKSNDPEDKDSK